MTLRSVAPADLKLLMHWQTQPHVTAAVGNDDWKWETEISRNPLWREQLIAEVDGRPIGADSTDKGSSVERERTDRGPLPAGPEGRVRCIQLNPPAPAPVHHQTSAH